MNRIHIVGRKNHGKTGLVVDLVEELTRRGLRVGCIKHSAHSHELDSPGKDSYRQSKAGAEPTAVVTRDSIAIYVTRPQDDCFYELMAPLYEACDLVLVEGHIDADGIKLEVWRAEKEDPPLATERNDLTAVVSDDETAIDALCRSCGSEPFLPRGPLKNIPIWPRTDIACLADNILALVASISVPLKTDAAIEGSV
jgi:molybdopterin-guanine dinucleotide biosynthesis adapter protein